MRKIFTVGGAICAICVAASLAISVYYAQSIASNEFEAVIYSGVGIAAVLWEVSGLHRASELYAAGRRMAAGACMVGLAFAIVITVQYDLGFIASLFEGKASIGEAKAGERATLEAERRRLESQITKAGLARPRAAIEGELSRAETLAAAANRADLAYKGHLKAIEDEAGRGGCGETCGELKKLTPQFFQAKQDAEGARDAGPNVGLLRQELGVAVGVEAATARIAEINASLKPLSESKVGDARSSYLSLIAGISDFSARVFIAGLFIVFLLCGRVFAPWVFLDRRKPEIAAVAGGPVFVNTATAGAGQAPAAQSEPSEMEIFGPAYDEHDGDEIDKGLSLEEIDRLFDDYNAKAGGDISESMRAPSAPVLPEADEDLPLAEASVRRIVQRFVDECLVIVIPQDGEDMPREGAQTMQDAFSLWVEESEITEKINKMAFGKHMTAILEANGGKRVKSNSWFYVGVQIKPAHAHRMAQKLGNAGEETEKDGKAVPVRRLGTLSRGADLEFEEVQGSA